eukprot:CAMPEP_0170653190 /NCGR_PEP_ID=MMETSP0224-20130122/47280_1 /TAXON_ID=285029 /ORGANISM="Togula jolla, Strain CCCM 725" /LENGTH=335 /DNA_ID=CAMNT_0010985055 /DNA_START=152 /DNA_END=1157 /DNA_ORIENTATION=+
MVLGFMIVFRSNQAYSRYWEGAGLVMQVKGEWFNAASSLFAFCSSDPTRASEVDDFQHGIVRLMSMLYCSALEQISFCGNESSKERFNIFDNSGLEQQYHEFLQTNSKHKVEVIVQWLQRSIVRGAETGVLPIPAPILSRVFQELSRGVVTLTNAQKINELPFPMGYSQMLSVLLLIYTIGLPLTCGVVLTSWTHAGPVTCLSTFVMWAIMFISRELEMPFGTEANDLPLQEWMEAMNDSLQILLDPGTQASPTFTFSPTDLHGPLQESRAASAVRRSRARPSRARSLVMLKIEMLKIEELLVEGRPPEVPRAARVRGSGPMQMAPRARAAICLE